VRADGGLPYPFGFGFTVMVYRISSFLSAIRSGEVEMPGKLFKRGRS
jgi:hypothetical protein